jgi:hypothetical protein
MDAKTASGRVEDSREGGFDSCRWGAVIWRLAWFVASSRLDRSFASGADLYDAVQADAAVAESVSADAAASLARRPPGVEVPSDARGLTAALLSAEVAEASEVAAGRGDERHAVFCVGRVVG